MKMEWFTNRVKGSVSIMLCLVMLPMVIFSAMVVDVSRLMAAKTMISGAGDLTLNARMSEYDVVLQEMYGLFASAGSEEELEDALREYFAQTIEGIVPESSEESVSSFVNELVGMIFGTSDASSFDFDNLIDMQMDKASFSITGVPGSALANTRVLKRQIIDAMKYRAPVSISSTILNKIHALKNSGSQTEVIEKKVEYTTALDKLSAACATALEDILSYDVLCKELNENMTNFSLQVCNKARLMYFGAALAEAIRVNTQANIYDSSILRSNAASLETMFADDSEVLDILNEENWKWELDSGKSWEQMSIDELENRLIEMQKSLKDYIAAIELVVESSPRNGAGELEKRLKMDFQWTVVDGSIRINNDTFRGISKWYDSIVTVLGWYSDAEKEKAHMSTGYIINDIKLYEKWDKWLYFAENQSMCMTNEELMTESKEALDLINLYEKAQIKYDDRIQEYKSALETYKTRLEESEAEGNAAILNEGTLEELEQFFSESKAVLQKLIEIRSNIDAFDDKVRSTQLHIDIRNQFLSEANECVKEYCAWIEMIKYYAEKASKDMDDILTILAEIEERKEDWKNSIDNVNDGVTKASFENDFKTTTELYKEEDIKNLAEEIKKGEWKLPYAEKMADAVETIRFMDKPVIRFVRTFTVSVSGSEEESEAEKKEKEVYGAESRETLNSTPANEEKAMAFCEPLAGIALEDIEKAVEAYIKDYRIEDCFLTADLIVHKENGRYSVSKMFLGGEFPRIQGADHEVVFLCSDNLKPIQRFGYIDGFKDNPNPNETESFSVSPSGGKDISLRDMLTALKLINDELYDKERFVLILFELAPPESIEPLSKEQDEQKQKIDNDIKNDDTLSEKEPTPSPEDKRKPESSLVLFAQSNVADYINEGKTATPTPPSGYTGVEGTEVPNTSDMKGTKIPEQKKSNKEGYKSEGKKASGSLSSGKKWLSKLKDIGDKVVEDSYLEEYITEMFTCDYDWALKSKKGVETFENLLGEHYEQDTDWFGRELEYIIWGDSNLQKNVDNTYITIFVIRFALNAIYAFTAADIQSFALEMATAIAGWTVFGVPLVQAVITVALALAESGLDIRDLKNGEDVVIYKSKATFRCSPSGLIDSATQEMKEVAAKEVTEKINEYKQFIEEKVKGAADGAAETIGKNIDELNGYIDELTDSPIDGMVSQAVDFITTPLLTGLSPLTTKIKAIDGITQELVNETIDNTLQTIRESIAKQSPSAMKEAEKAALDYVEKNLASRLKDKVGKLILNASSPVDMKELNSVITQEIVQNSGLVDAIKLKVKETTDALSSQMKENLMDIKDRGIGAFEDFMTEQSEKLSGAINGSLTEKAGSWVKNDADISSSSEGLSLTLNYKEYCKIFAFVAIAANEEMVLQRTAALIQANVQTKEMGKSGLNIMNINETVQELQHAFSMKTAYTMYRIDAKVSIKTIFPWGALVTADEESLMQTWDISLSKMGQSSITIWYGGANGY